MAKGVNTVNLYHAWQAQATSHLLSLKLHCLCLPFDVRLPVTDCQDCRATMLFENSAIAQSEIRIGHMRMCVDVLMAVRVGLILFFFYRRQKERKKKER